MWKTNHLLYPSFVFAGELLFLLSVAPASTTPHESPVRRTAVYNISFWVRRLSRILCWHDIATADRIHKKAIIRLTIFVGTEVESNGPYFSGCSYVQQICWIRNLGLLSKAIIPTAIRHLNVNSIPRNRYESIYIHLKTQNFPLQCPFKENQENVITDKHAY